MRQLTVISMFLLFCSIGWAVEVSIDGEVFLLNDKPVSGLPVLLVNSNSFGKDEGSWTITNQEGRFQYYDLVPGFYEIVFLVPGQQNVRRMVTVNSGNTTQMSKTYLQTPDSFAE